MKKDCKSCCHFSEAEGCNLHRILVNRDFCDSYIQLQTVDISEVLDCSVFRPTCRCPRCGGKIRTAKKDWTNGYYAKYTCTWGNPHSFLVRKPVKVLRVREWDLP